MKKRIILLTLCALLSGWLTAQERFNEEFVIPLSNPGEVGTLKVNFSNGNIHVEAYSGKEVIISASENISKVKEQPEITKDGLKKIPNYSLGLRITEEDNEVRVSNSRGNMNQPLDLEIKVPRRFHLNLRSHRGNITITDVSGELDINTHSGDIEMNEISGAASANSHGGDIVATFRSVTDDIPMAFTSYSGKVDITFPSNFKATAKLRSDRGDVFTDFDMELQRRTVNIDQKDERYEVSIDSWTVGKINGGGPEFMFKNYSDNIYIRKRKGDRARE